MERAVVPTEAPLEPRILVADDDPIVRRALRAILEASDLDVVGEAENAAAVLTALRETRPTVALVDVDLPASGGVALVKSLGGIVPATHVILLAPSEHPDQAIEGLRAGARGYLPKDIALRALPRAVRAVARGEMAVGRALIEPLVDALRQGCEDRPRLRPVQSVLTDREWEVLDLLCEDQSTAAIAGTLFLSRETVRTHVKHITRKLGVSGRAEAVAVAASLRGRPNPPVAVGERPA